MFSAFDVLKAYPQAASRTPNVRPSESVWLKYFLVAISRLSHTPPRVSVADQDSAPRPACCRYALMPSSIACSSLSIANSSVATEQSPAACATVVTTIEVANTRPRATRIRKDARGRDRLGNCELLAVTGL